MTTLNDFIERLDQAEPSQWEEIYASTPIQMTIDEAFEIVASKRTYADWFSYRSKAGPPGVPLPPFDEALTRVMTNANSTPLDAYSIVFSDEPLREDTPRHILLGILLNCASSSLRGGLNWFSVWLVVRASLAAIALGEPAQAWRFLDGLTHNGERHPLLDKLVIFEPIKGQPELEKSPWIQGTICRLWAAGLNVPLIPRLPFPEAKTGGSQHAEDVIEILSGLGAKRLVELVKSFVEATDLSKMSKYQEEPLVQELQRLLLSSETPEIPEIESLPSWFAEWAKSVFQTGNLLLARLAGLLIHKHGKGDPVLVTGLVSLSARAKDLPALEGLRQNNSGVLLLNELEGAAKELPEKVANALIAELLPKHINHAEALPTLAENLDVLEKLITKPGGLIEHKIKMVRHIAQGRTQEHETARPVFKAFQERVRQQALGLGEVYFLTPLEVENVAAGIEVPAIELAFLELAQQTESQPTERLIGALAIIRAIKGTNSEVGWSAPFLFEASEAIRCLGASRLFPLRLRILDGLIAQAHRLSPLALLYFQRGNMRAGLHPDDPKIEDRALADFEMSAREARKIGEPNILADATAAWSKIIANDSTQAARREEALEQIHGVLALPLQPDREAALLLAKSHLEREQDPKARIDTLERALNLVPAKDIFRYELAAELVDALCRAGRIKQAIERGLSYFNQITDERGDTELGMLHSALGQAFRQSGRPSKEIRQYLEAALQRFRGNDPYNDITVRLFILRHSLDEKEWAFVDEQVRVLLDRWEKLNERHRFDTAQFLAEIALIRKDYNKAREFIKKALGVIQKQTWREELLLTLDRLDSCESKEYIYIEQEKNNKTVINSTNRDFTEEIAYLSTKPAVRAFFCERSKLFKPSQLEQAPFSLQQVIYSNSYQSLQVEVSQGYFYNNPDAIEARLKELDHEPVETTVQPGVIVAKVAFLAELVRLGRYKIEEAYKATQSARAVLAEINDLDTRAALLGALGGIWIPEDHKEDLVRDFALGVELFREAIKIMGGDKKASLFLLEGYARSLRYSPLESLQENLRESHELYSLILERLGKQGNPDAVASTLNNIAELEAHLAKGDRISRLLHVENLLEKALSIVASPYLKAEITISLASWMTQLGQKLEGEEKIKKLQEACNRFDSVEYSILTEDTLLNLKLNRVVCEATLARLTKGRNNEIEIWRKTLAEINDKLEGTKTTIKHNLAIALFTGKEVTPSEAEEGLRLCEQSLKIMKQERNLRELLETGTAAGIFIGRVLHPIGDLPKNLLPWDPSKAWQEARKWLRLSIDASRQLGLGEELAYSAFALCDLVASAPSTALACEVAEEGWKVISEASPYLLFNRNAQEWEAKSAYQITSYLFNRFFREVFFGVGQNTDLAMKGPRAEELLRWLVRSQLPLRRPLRARLSRPPEISLELWMKWQEAVRLRDSFGLVKPLAQIREKSPSFLSTEPTLERTWRWLEGRPGAIAVDVILAYPNSIAFVLRINQGKRDVCVLCLPMRPPPLSPEELAEHMKTAPYANGSAEQAHEQMIEWGQKWIVQPILRFLGDKPSAILWSPTRGLRLVASSALWDKIPVANVLGFDFSDLSMAPSRPLTSLVLLADPENIRPEQRLKEHGKQSLEKLFRAASQLGPVRRLASSGKEFGASLLGRGITVRDTPASAQDLLNEAAEHDLIVLIAHGEVNSPEDAALICVNREGQAERLDVEMLSRYPECFVGARVLLLSCEGGRIGMSLAEPGGLAGTLISAGARWVVAPLWPVSLDVADMVVRTVLDGLLAGLDPWVALSDHTLKVTTQGQGPAVLAKQRRKTALQKLAFVTWIG